MSKKDNFNLIISLLIIPILFLCGCSNDNNSKNSYIPIIKADDNKSMAFDEDNKITTSPDGIDYVGSDKVGYVCLANSWREVTIPEIEKIPIVCEAKEYKAYEDKENKYLLFLANYGKATGNQDEINKWIEKEPNLNSTSVYYPSGSIEYLVKHDYGFISQNSVFKNDIPIGYEFYLTVYRDDNDTPKFGIYDNNNILRGTIFEYDKNRYGLMYMRYNKAWDIDLESLCYMWTPNMATEDDIINQIINSPSMNKEYE